MRRRGWVDYRAAIGEPPQDRDAHPPYCKPWIHPMACIEAFASVDAGTARPTYIGEDAWLMKTAHVGHDAYIGPQVELTPGCVVSGWVMLLGCNRVGVGAVFKPYIMVGLGARIGAGSVVIRNVPPGEVWAGNPARRLAGSPVWDGGDAWQEVDVRDLILSAAS